ncbi:hypothetical protein [Streptomyces melanogenes]|uniref:hypothetical protein n=1 Tax=Streptomyces melanogenes TaxID=67326 RepID=UPI00167CCB50|nr:hypothetical protein [Streptomyces melanogenes]GGP60583.1 hypothetical protein GCM10010278_42080 [Streptomyces melanogenes]
MTGSDRPAVWSFTLDEDEDWVPSREPAGDENLRRAVETLLLGIASAKAAEAYLAAWRADTERWGSGFSLSTAGAGAERVSAGTVRLVDLYGQFEDCDIAADEFDAMLRDYLAAARAAEG